MISKVTRDTVQLAFVGLGIPSSCDAESLAREWWRGSQLRKPRYGAYRLLDLGSLQCAVIAWNPAKRHAPLTVQFRTSKVSVTP